MFVIHGTVSLKSYELPLLALNGFKGMIIVAPLYALMFTSRMNENEWEHAKTGNEWGPKNSGFLGSPKKGWFYTATVASYRSHHNMKANNHIKTL